MRSFLVVIVVVASATDIASAQTLDAAFVLSLSTSGCDLAPYYRQVVAEATSEFRGDADYVVVRSVDSTIASESGSALSKPSVPLEVEHDPFFIQPFPHRAAKRPKELVLFAPIW